MLLVGYHWAALEIISLKNKFVWVTYTRGKRRCTTLAARVSNRQVKPLVSPLFRFQKQRRLERVTAQGDIGELSAVPLTKTDHERGVYPVHCVLGRVALDAAIGPQVTLVDLMVVLACVRLEHLQAGHMSQ